MASGPIWGMNIHNLLVLNVGNGWVAEGCWGLWRLLGVAGFIIHSDCGSFPKIPSVYKAEYSTSEINPSAMD